jgi:hypothetical protein
MEEQGGGVIKNTSYVCKSVLDEMGGDISDMLWLMRRAYQWISEVMPAKNAFPCIKQVRLNVSSIGQVALPKDYVRYTKIAVDYGGKLWTLGLDNTIALPTNLGTCETVEQITNQTNDVGVWFSPFYSGGSYFTAAYSSGGGFNDSYYRVDEQLGIIQFLGAVPRGGKLVLEYLSNNIDANEFTLVPTIWIDSLRYFLMWRLCEFKPTKYKMLSNPQMLYEYAKDAAQTAGGVTPEEILDAYWSGSGFTLR